MSDHLAHIDRVPLITTVMERVQLLIDQRGIAPGQRIPSERELQQGFGVGRSTVREALRALEALGVLEIVQGRGAFVRPPSGAEASKLHISGDKLSEDWSTLGAVVEARMLIERETARLAALRRTPIQLDRMEASLKAFNEARHRADLPALVLADVEFHAAIAEAANPVLAHCLRSLGVLAVKSRQLSLRRVERHEHVESRHTEIFEAIAASHAGLAAEAMSAHLSDFTIELGLIAGSSLQGLGLVSSGEPIEPDLLGAGLVTDGTTDGLGSDA